MYPVAIPYFWTSGIHNDIEICKTFFIEGNQMSKIQINDLDDLNVEQFATLTDLEAAGIQGGEYDPNPSPLPIIPVFGPEGPFTYIPPVIGPDGNSLGYRDSGGIN
jgi:hypothetical protein